MVPAHPPLPTASNLPFQPDAGSQISVLISESLLGVRVAVMRQNAGRLANGFAAAPPRADPGPAGGTNAPAATIWAESMRALGSARLASFSHDVAATAGAAAHSTIAK